MMRAAVLPGGAATGIGGLPHLDAVHAVGFALGNMELPSTQDCRGGRRPKG